MCTPLPQEFKHLTDSFDRGSIYAACQSAFAANDVHVKNLHCFYFGFKGAVHEDILWQRTTQKRISRILLLEEMLFSAKIMYSIDSITLTTLSLLKHRLITKEHMKNIYKDPKNPKLKFNTLTENQYAFFTQRYNRREIPNESKSSTFFLDNSLHDDLENLVEVIKHFNSLKLEIDRKFIFHLPMITQKQASKLQIQDHEYLKSFYCFPKVNPDVPIEEMLKSNSKSRFESWNGLRLTFTIPTDDYPVCLDEGFFILPLCDIFYDSLFEFTHIEFDGDSMSFHPLVFTQEDIDFSSQIISNDQVCRFIDSQLALDVYRQDYPLMKDFEFLYLKNFKPFPNTVSVPKEKGDRVVFIDESYVNECSLQDIVLLDSKIQVQTFQFQSKIIRVFECIDDDAIYGF